MQTSLPHRLSTGHAVRAQAMTLVRDLSVINRIEATMRLAAADRPRNRRSPAKARFADWLAELR